MQSFKQKFTIAFAALFISTVLFGRISTNATAAQVVLPKVHFITAPTTEYTAGDRVRFNINALPYGGRVEYRVVLWEDSKKTYHDLWHAGNGHPTRYYTSWRPYGNETFTLGWPITEPGDYRITVYVKRLGIANSKAALKGMNCDSYAESVAFKVKPKITGFDLNKAGTTYGSSNPASLQSFKGEVKITAANVTLNNAAVDGNITITGNNSALKNVTVNGNIIVNPGSEGSANLENVTAKEIQVLSGSNNSIHLKGVKADRLTTDSVDGVKVTAQPNTIIGQTILNSNTDVEAAGGSFGEVVISNKNNDNKYISLIGNFNKQVVVKSFASIYAEEGALIPRVEISSADKGVEVALSGAFKDIAVKNDAYLTLDVDSRIERLAAEASTAIYLDTNSVIEMLTSSIVTYTFGDGRVIGKTGVVVEGTSDIQVPTAENVLGSIDPKIESGYISDGSNQVAVLNFILQGEGGAPISATNGDLYVFDGISTVRMAYPGGNTYPIIKNADGTLALAGGNYEIYFPSGNKWYVLKFTTKQIGEEGTLSSQLITINGKPYGN